RHNHRRLAFLLCPPRPRRLACDLAALLGGQLPRACPPRGAAHLAVLTGRGRRLDDLGRRRCYPNPWRPPGSARLGRFDPGWRSRRNAAPRTLGAAFVRPTLAPADHALEPNLQRLEGRGTHGGEASRGPHMRTCAT